MANKRKRKVEWFMIPYVLVGLFFTIFFCLYIGEFGLTNLIIEESNKWHQLFNIGAWMILTIGSINILMDGLKYMFVKVSGGDE